MKVPDFPERVWEPTRVVDGVQLWASRKATAQDTHRRWDVWYALRASKRQ